MKERIIDYDWLMAQAPQYKPEVFAAWAHAIADAIDEEILRSYIPKKKSILFRKQSMLFISPSF